jgi:hypothetical protein
MATISYVVEETGPNHVIVTWDSVTQADIGQAFKMAGLALKRAQASGSFSGGGYPALEEALSVDSPTYVIAVSLSGFSSTLFGTETASLPQAASLVRPVLVNPTTADITFTLLFEKA